MRSITLRPITQADLPFLFTVYAAVRAEELAQVDWDEAQKLAFLASQFNAQHHHYQTYRWPSEIRIVDIALLPAYRQLGIGSELLRQTQAEGARIHKRVSIHVEKYNPAYRLYTRLGFKKIGETGVYDLLDWQPEQAHHV